MTSDELDRLTIGELRAAADRVAAALAVLREAGAWTGVVGERPLPPMPPTAPIQPQPPLVAFSPAELAERKRLLSKMRPELPPEIAAIEDA
jgi:hypothetical protein